MSQSQRGKTTSGNFRKKWYIFAEKPRDARAPWAVFECLTHIAKFHYTDTDTDFFAAKLRWVRAGPFGSVSVSV